jgi:hypothetical protein
VLAFASWLALVAPVAAAQSSEPGSVPAMWTQLRARWEYGHATGFVIQLGGFCALLASILAETPGAPRERLRRSAPRTMVTNEWREASGQGGLIP